jgi:polyisoprenyl-phosphate glycosyltransferase
VVAFAAIAYLLGLKLLFGISLKGWTSTIVTILFLGGVQLVSIGILGEYVGRIFDEVKRRPLYVVKDEVGFEPGEQAAEAMRSARTAG